MRQLKQTRFSPSAIFSIKKVDFRPENTSTQVGECCPAPGGAPRRCPRRFGEDPARSGPERPKSRPERPKSEFPRIRRHRRDPLRLFLGRREEGQARAAAKSAAPSAPKSGLQSRDSRASDTIAAIRSSVSSSSEGKKAKPAAAKSAAPPKNAPKSAAPK